MQTSMWLMLGLVLLAGALGGVVNAFMTDNGFLLPKTEQLAGGSTLLRPGYLGNVLVGAVAALASWGLYGPLAAHMVAGTAQALGSNPPDDRMGLTLASLVGAMLVGIGGARWLSSEVDKNLLRATAAEAAGKQPSDAVSKRIAMATPADAFQAVRELKD